MMSHHKNSRRGGFTLVELSIVLVIIGVVSAAGLMLFSAYIEGQAYRLTVQRMETIRQALYDYRIAFNRLPCRAQTTSVTPDSTSFGVALDPLMGCVGAFGQIHQDLPVRTLGLSDEMAFDGWGRRFLYYVDSTADDTDGFDSIAADDTTARISVTHNQSGVTVATTAVYALVSGGPDGHGMYTRTSVSPINAGITNANQLINCKCTSAGANNSGASMTSYVRGEAKPDPTNPLNNFDDIVIFATRADLRDAEE